MSYYRRAQPLPPQPFTGMLRVVDSHAIRHEGSIRAFAKLGLAEPEDHVFDARALRAVERVLVGIERFWDTEPPAAMSIKEMIARFEAGKSKPPVFVDPTPTRPAPSSKPVASAPARASANLFGDDDD